MSGSSDQRFETSISSFVAHLQSVKPVLAGLSKYESSFTPEAKQLLQSAQISLVKTIDDAATWRITGGIQPYISADVTLENVKRASAQQQQALNLLLSGSIPVPRSAKEDLSNTRLTLMGLKFELPSRQHELVTQLRTVCSSVHTQKNQQLDDTERNLDELLRQVLQELYDVTTLEEKDLTREQATLEKSIQEAQDQQYYSLVLNSLQRLHASQLEEESEEPEEEEDDEDDPFYMPLAPAAFKLADSNKYALLAQPLDNEQEKDFMIVMDNDDAGTAEECDASTSTAAREAVALPTTSEAPSETPFALPQMAEAVEPSPAPDAAHVVPPVDVAAATAAGAADASSSQDVVAAPSSPTPPANEEKLKSFMNFLSGENPGACMFHAQMRLSFDGCRKLANFLKSSARVRALSLSHNYLGDDGLKILCEGLYYNSSITALDLPDNNVGDEGIKALAYALRSNVSLTQLQLAYNRIGDEGAVVISQLIKTNNSIKKLGMSHNNIGKRGCQALTEAIASNQSLKHLQLLPGNPVEDKDAKALAKALKRNKKFSIRTFLGLNE